MARTDHCKTPDDPLPNPKWENFALAFVRVCGDASKAYREAYPASKSWNDASVWVRASRLMAHAKVQPRIRHLQKQVEADGIADAEEVAKFLTKVMRNDASVRPSLHDDKGLVILDPLTNAPLTGCVPIRVRIMASAQLCKLRGLYKPVKVELAASSAGGAVNPVSDPEVAHRLRGYIDQSQDAEIVEADAVAAAAPADDEETKQRRPVNRP